MGKPALQRRARRRLVAWILTNARVKNQILSISESAALKPLPNQGFNLRL
jgi:hypothetical protein